MAINKKIIKKTVFPLNRSDENELYLTYINALIKAEDLQNRLEKMCSSMINTPNSFNSKKTKGLNNYLNNVLAKLMIIQNIINYISGKK